MNKELNTQLEILMADFNKRQEEICNEIANLEKSTNAIKNSILKEYSIVEKAFVEDLYDVMKIAKLLSDKKCHEGTSKWSDEYDMFSVFTSSNETLERRFYFDTETDNIHVTFKKLTEYSPKEEFICHPVNNALTITSQTRYYTETYNKYRKEAVIHYYKSGMFKEDVIKAISELTKKRIENYESILKTHKRILENAEPIEVNDSHWSDYIMYLLKWSSEHADKEFAGMSPACYDEWLDNEMKE
mgnify:CR=1 FL=1